jgi:hypothetical protein
MVHTGLGKKQNPVSKVTRAKRARGMTQEVKHLSSHCKALSSNPNTARKKKNFVSIFVSMTFFGVSNSAVFQIYSCH